MRQLQIVNNLKNVLPIELEDDELDVRSLQSVTEVIDCDLAPLGLVPVNNCIVNIALVSLASTITIRFILRARRVCNRMSF